MVLTGIPWNGGDSPLDQEPDRHLCGGFFVLIADLPQGLVLQQTIAAAARELQACMTVLWVVRQFRSSSC